MQFWVGNHQLNTSHFVIITITLKHKKDVDILPSVGIAFLKWYRQLDIYLKTLIGFLKSIDRFFEL